MQKLVLAQSKDLAPLSKSLRRCQIEMDTPIIAEDFLASFVQENRVFILKDGAKILSFLVVSFFPMDEIFPNSIKKQDDFLFDLGYFGEPLLLIQGIFTDPMYRNKGYASLLFNSLCSVKKQASMFALLKQEWKDTLPFFEKLGFKVKGLNDSSSLILVRKKKKEGLCSDPSF